MTLIALISISLILANFLYNQYIDGLILMPITVVLLPLVFLLGISKFIIYSKLNITQYRLLSLIYLVSPFGIFLMMSNSSVVTFAVGIIALVIGVILSFYENYRVWLKG